MHCSVVIKLIDDTNILSFHLLKNVFVIPYLIFSCKYYFGWVLSSWFWCKIFGWNFIIWEL